MLYFTFAYLWSWCIVPFTFVLLRPFVKLTDNMNCRHFLFHILGIHNNISGEQFINEGFILGNHRSWLDAFIDPFVSDSITIIRRLAVVGAPFVVLLSYIDDRVIVINRGKDSRDSVYAKCIIHMQKSNNKRIMFYPEGTRNS